MFKTEELYYSLSKTLSFNNQLSDYLFTEGI